MYQLARLVDFGRSQVTLGRSLIEFWRRVCLNCERTHDQWEID